MICTDCVLTATIAIWFRVLSRSRSSLRAASGSGAEISLEHLLSLRLARAVLKLESGAGERGLPEIGRLVVVER